MTIDQVRAYAPAAFAPVAAPEMSARYAHVTTATVIDALLQDGWTVTNANQRRSRNPERRVHGAHRIALTHPDLPDHPEGRPQMFIGNAGNGESAFRQIGGFLRAACLNQLYTGLRVVGGVFHHRGADLEDRIVAGARDLRKNFDKVLSVVDFWRELRLSDQQEQEFFRAAVAFRWPSGVVVDTRGALNPRRVTDVQPRTLWSVFNRSQEALVRGHFQAQFVQRDEDGREIGQRWHTVRRTTSLTAAHRINTGLWNLAEEYETLLRA
jgi:hypothetical protein